MHSRSGHLLGVLVGVIAAPVLAFLILRAGEDLTRIEVFDASPPGFPSMSTAGSASAAVLLAAAAVITGLLAGTWRLSPLAPLAAGLPMVAFGLYAYVDYVGSQLLLAHLPTSMAPSADELEQSGLWQVLGLTLMVSAAWPWRWTGRPAPSFRPERGILGIFIGVVAFADLWYLIQLANPVGFVTVVFAAHLPHVFDLILIPQLMAAAVLGTLAAARWVSPIAAAIAGLPLLVTGLLLVLVPVTAEHGIARFVWSSRAIELGLGQSVGLGAFLLFGGLLATSAALPWRWHKPSSSPAPGAGDDAPVSEPV
jgi:hypothetical protein